MHDGDTFLHNYLATALWCTTGLDQGDTDDRSLQKRGFTTLDFSEEALADAKRDCDAFREKCAAELEGSEPDAGGHDLWLTRNEHGCGFWDGDWPEPAATALTDAAHALGRRDIDVGDDGKLYFSPG